MTFVAKDLLSPPFAFLIVLCAVGVLFYLFSRLAFKAKQTQESKEPYACGEDFKDHMIQPDYSQFFPFAFFFTILHVVVLVIATVPKENMETFAIALVYILGAAVGLFSLLRK